MGGVGTGDLDGARRGKKLGFIPHYHNRITVVNKAGISAPTVAFGEDPSLFPPWASPHHLKKKKIYPLFPPFMSLARLQQGAQRTHMHTDRHKLLVCVMCACMCALMAGQCLSVQQAAWPAHQKGLHLHNSNKTLSAPCPSLTHPSFHLFCHPAFLSTPSPHHFNLSILPSCLFLLPVY